MLATIKRELNEERAVRSEVGRELSSLRVVSDELASTSSRSPDPGAARRRRARRMEATGGAATGSHPLMPNMYRGVAEFTSGPAQYYR